MLFFGSRWIFSSYFSQSAKTRKTAESTPLFHPFIRYYLFHLPFVWQALNLYYLCEKLKLESVENVNQIKSVCVYCASSTQIDPCYFEAARELGILLAQNSIRLINGAGNMGLMSEVADTVLKNGGQVTGVIPRFMIEQNWHHTGLTKLIEVDSMHERKNLMAQLSDAVIALPGGCGTMEELLEIITWKQLGLYLNPVIILNTNGFYDPLLEMFNRAIQGNFMRTQHGDIWQIAATPQQAVELACSTARWNSDIRKFAAI